MGDPRERSALDFDMLRRFGAKWAVFTAMTANMIQKGIEVPHAVVEKLKTARSKIESGCFTPCARRTAACLRAAASRLHSSSSPYRPIAWM